MSQNQLITNDFIYRLKLRVTDAYVTYNTSQCNPCIMISPLVILKLNSDGM